MLSIQLTYRKIVVPPKLNKNEKKEDLNLPDFTIANILHTGNWMNETFSDHLKQFALSIQQYQVLRSLKKLKGQPADLQTLQAEMVSKNSNTTRLVEKLRLKGLITRFQNEENRRKVEIGKIQESFENSVVENLSKQEILDLNRLLIKIRNKE